MLVKGSKYFTKASNIQGLAGVRSYSTISKSKESVPVQELEEIPKDLLSLAKH
jgi:hypothetical protein